MFAKLIWSGCKWNLQGNAGPAGLVQPGARLQVPQSPGDKHGGGENKNNNEIMIMLIMTTMIDNDYDDKDDENVDNGNDSDDDENFVWLVIIDYDDNSRY